MLRGNRSSSLETLKLRACLIIIIQVLLSLAFVLNQAAAQKNDSIDVNSLKSELANSWSNAGKEDKAVKPPAQQSPALSAKDKLEQEEQAIINKLSTEPVKEDLTQGLTENPPPFKQELAEKKEEVVIQKNTESQQTTEVAEASTAVKEKKDSAKPEEKVTGTKVKETNLASQQNRIAELERKLFARTKELEETRSRLLLAETQVERLSGILDKMNNQKMAGFMGNSAPVTLKEAPIPAASSGVVKPVSNPPVKRSADESLVGIVSAQKAFLRSGPSANDSPIMTVSKGTRLVVETRNQDWYRVITPTGGRAWISSEMLKFGPGAEPGSGSNLRIGGYEKPKS